MSNIITGGGLSMIRNKVKGKIKYMYNKVVKYTDGDKVCPAIRKVIVLAAAQIGSNGS